ncbi:hypothetical protein AgCh_035385 [Apium graveolens]
MIHQIQMKGSIMLSWENVDAEVDNAELKEILENECRGSGLGYSYRSNSDKKSGKETEKTEPIKTDSKVKLNKKQLKQKLKDLHMKDKRKRSRKNRNGKMNLSHDLQVASFPFRVPDLNSGKVISESLSTSCRSAPMLDPLSADASRGFKPGENLWVFNLMTANERRPLEAEPVSQNIWQ